MSSTSGTPSTWSEQPTLGLAPLFHIDPAPGGPPCLTPDGHWRWNGEQWVAVDNAPHEPDAPAA